MFEIISTNRDDRWKALEAFIARWFKRPLSVDDGYSPAELDAAQRQVGIRLPKALREWYCLAGKRGDIWSIQDTFVAPHNLEVKNGLLNIYDECEHVTHWCIKYSELECDDPPVLQHPPITRRYGGSDPVEANDTLSEFALQMCVFSSKFAIDKGWTVYGFTDKDKYEVAELIACQYKAWAFPIWDWALSRLFGDNNVVLEYEQCGSIYCSAQTESYLDQTIGRLGAIGISWEKRCPRDQQL